MSEWKNAFFVHFLTIKFFFRLWKSYGVKVLVNTSNITTYEGCLKLIKTGMQLAPIGGIFNLAVVLRDSIFENQNAQKFDEALSVKAYSTKYLDEISRKLCPNLKYFVVFSSVSCGRGNAGKSFFKRNVKKIIFKGKF